jgi:hypothetical protein
MHSYHWALKGCVRSRTSLGEDEGKKEKSANIADLYAEV